MYLKVVLTVIAVCLILLTFKGFQPTPAVAQREVVHKVELVKIGGYHVNKWEILNIGKNERHPMSNEKVVKEQ